MTTKNLLLICLFGCAASALAADTSKSIIPDNVIACTPSSGCTSETLFGRKYKVLTTPRFTVMISLSNEGAYTRADVSIANNTGYSLNLSPEDFRVEVLTPKPRVLLYVPPSDLKDVPPPHPIPTAGTTTPAAAPLAITAPDATANPPATGDFSTEAKKKAALQEAIDQAAAQKDLPATSIPPNEVTRGKVYFERDRRDKKGQQVNVVLPIAGLVFEFPYVLQR